MVFPIVMYGCESWTIKKAEHRRMDAFELLCWRRLLRVPWTVQRSNHSILKKTSPEYSLEGLMLKLQYFGHLRRRTDSLEKKSYDQFRQHIKKQRHKFADKGPSGQSYGFSSSHVWMWELDYKESWVLKNWCFWTVVLKKTLENPLVPSLHGK